MILTRIKRGAERTHLLLRNKLATCHLPSLPVSRLNRAMRTAGLSAMAAYTATMPISQLHVATALAAAEGGSEPPSTQRGLASELPSLRFDPSSSQSVQFPEYKLGSVEVGKSNDLLQEEAAAQQAELAQQQAEAQKAQQLKEEQDRQQLLERQRAEQAEAARRLLPVPAAPTPASQPAAMTAAPAGPQPAADFAPGDVRAQLRAAAAAAFGDDQVGYLFDIIERESGFNPRSFNRNSGACGLFQALPCSKMGGMEVGNQIRWGIGYIRSRYGTPSNAWAFWASHHWY